MFSLPQSQPFQPNSSLLGSPLLSPTYKNPNSTNSFISPLPLSLSSTSNQFLSPNHHLWPWRENHQALQRVSSGSSAFAAIKSSLSSLHRKTSSTPSSTSSWKSLVVSSLSSLPTIRPLSSLFPSSPSSWIPSSAPSTNFARSCLCSSHATRQSSPNHHPTSLPMIC